MNTKLRLKGGGANSARLIIAGFFVVLLVITYVMDLAFATTVSDILIRWCMNFVLVLAMVPSILSGCGPNFASPVGICCGLLGAVLSINAGFTGVTSLVMALVFALPIAAVVGLIYGRLMNMIKGSEMMIATYVGFAFVSLMSIVWTFFPVTNDAVRLPMGGGVRTSVDLASSFGHLLDNFLSVKIGDFTSPVGFMLFCLLFCVGMKLFLNSRAGISMCTAGENPRFAESIGINVDKYRLLGSTISVVLSAFGIIFYSQSYGMMQFYQAPLMMGFLAVASILIGGATTRKASISHAILGALLFNGILTTSMPVANAIAPNSNLAEVVRMIISNGIIVFALTKIRQEA